MRKNRIVTLGILALNRCTSRIFDALITKRLRTKLLVLHVQIQYSIGILIKEVTDLWHLIKFQLILR